MVSRKEAEACVAAFKLVRVNHPALATVDEQVTAAIREKASAAHLLVYGAPGVGKSTMLRQIVARFTAEAAPGTVPVVRVEARVGDNGVFSRIDYYRQVLGQLGEHVVAKQVLVNVQDTKGRNRSRTEVDWLDLRDGMEAALQRLQVRAVIIDEAQLLMKVDKAQQLLDQLDWLKSMTNVTEVLHVLGGNYDLLDFRNLSGQAARRGRDVHFARYHYTDAEERTAFLGAVNYLLEHLGVPCEQEEILRHWFLLYERSIGCIGNVKDWLVEALAAALATPGGRVTWPLVEQSAPTVARSWSMGSEAASGEQRLVKSATKISDLRAVLGMPADPPPDPSLGAGNDATKPKRGRGRPRKTADGS
ncbi:MAG: ATP-binding protein [Ktedonobacterales bacterium]|nr:ATP-binding protein [Ktedonobacterales bacterium]